MTGVRDTPRREAAHDESAARSNVERYTPVVEPENLLFAPYQRKWKIKRRLVSRQGESTKSCMGICGEAFLETFLLVSAKPFPSFCVFNFVVRRFRLSRRQLHCRQSHKRLVALSAKVQQGWILDFNIQLNFYRRR
jgi:hypothetical protein